MSPHRHPPPAVPSAPTPPYQASPPPPPSSPIPLPPPPPTTTSRALWMIIIIIVGAVLVVGLGVSFFCWRKNRNRRRAYTPPPSTPPIPSPPIPSTPPRSDFQLERQSQVRFTLDELREATNDFSDSNFVGEGGSGTIHRGVLPDGKEVAVKSLKSGSHVSVAQFEAEVKIIGHIHHRNLVSLVGHCLSGDQRTLIYEYIPNHSLEFHLHGEGRPSMEWPARLKAAIGSAKGLAYMHEECYPNIIHCDIKPANILLDFDFEAKIADFGLARIISGNDTHVSTQVKGTFGYIAPEYASTGRLSVKSDVYAFGVMLLELITGRRALDTAQSSMEGSLVYWSRPLLTRTPEDGIFDALVDPRLQNHYGPNEMARMVVCAAACVRRSARRRPHMSKIVQALEGDISLGALYQGVEPGPSTIYSSSDSSDDGSSQYHERMENFRRMALETSQES